MHTKYQRFHTSICERSFALMNNLKTARRHGQEGNLLLRTLMTICKLGQAWDDPNTITVDESVEEWRSQTKRGRYTSRRCGGQPGSRSQTL